MVSKMCGWITSQGALIIGQWTLGIRYWALGIGYWASGFKYLTLDIMYWALAIRYWALDNQSINQSSIFQSATKHDFPRLKSDYTELLSQRPKVAR